MNQDQLVSVVDNLETFIELKNQNLLIYSWIQLKKQAKTMPPPPYFRNKSISETFRNVLPYDSVNLGPFGTQPLIKPPPFESTDFNQLTTQRYPNQVQNIQTNIELFQTFNKTRDMNKISIPQIQTYQYQPSHKTKLPTKYYEDEEENDQFQDIVLDRLSKLQENINRLMQEKRLKEEKRGIVGTPLTYKQYEHSYDDNAEEIDQNSIERSQVEESQKNSYRQSYESWQPSPIKGCNKDIIYNFKYIPMIKKEPVNIYKIRELIDHTHREGQNEYMYNYQRKNNDRNKLRAEKMQPVGNATYKIIKVNGSERKSAQHSREMGSSTLYMNRYDGNKSARNSNQGNQVHFVPKNIEMQTVIEPRAKYNRNNSNKNILVRGKQQNANNERKLKLKAKVSNSSSGSYFSSHSEAANNRSALY